MIKNHQETIRECNVLELSRNESDNMELLKKLEVIDNISEDPASNLDARLVTASVFQASSEVFNSRNQLASTPTKWEWSLSIMETFPIWMRFGDSDNLEIFWYGECFVIYWSMRN